MRVIPFCVNVDAVCEGTNIMMGTFGNFPYVKISIRFQSIRFQYEVVLSMKNTIAKEDNMNILNINYLIYCPIVSVTFDLDDNMTWWGVRGRLAVIWRPTWTHSASQRPSCPNWACARHAPSSS